jgi:hypothetical protein
MNQMSPMNSMNQMSPMNSMNQMSPMNSMNQMNPMNPMNSMSPMNQSNLNQDSNTPFDRPSSFDSRSFDSRKQSISFNPEPSILEIEPREVNSDIKLDGISFEDLDSAPVNLDFEEL